MVGGQETVPGNESNNEHSPFGGWQQQVRPRVGMISGYGLLTKETRHVFSKVSTMTIFTFV